jgi:hypothetical protein
MSASYTGLAWTRDRAVYQRTPSHGSETLLDRVNDGRRRVAIPE